MVRRRQRERSLFEVLLPDGHKLWPDWLRRIVVAGRCARADAHDAARECGAG